MKEKGSKLRNALFAATAITGIGAGSACVFYQEPSPLPEPPEGFSRNTDEYKYRIAAKEEGILRKNEVVLFTNSEPVIVDGFLVAKDVYCPLGNRKFPDFQYNYRDEAGCKKEFMDLWIRPNDVTFSDNQGIE